MCYKKVSTLLGLVVASFYFAYHIIGGDHGVLSLSLLSQQLLKDQKRLEKSERKCAQLQNQIALFSDRIDTDILDYQAREFLNYAEPEEKVIFYTDESNSGQDLRAFSA